MLSDRIKSSSHPTSTHRLALRSTTSTLYALGDYGLEVNTPSREVRVPLPLIVLQAPHVAQQKAVEQVGETVCAKCDSCPVGERRSEALLDIDNTNTLEINAGASTATLRIGGMVCNGSLKHEGDMVYSYSTVVGGLEVTE